MLVLDNATFARKVSWTCVCFTEVDELDSFLVDENCVYRRWNGNCQVTTPDVDTVQGSAFCVRHISVVYTHVRAICFFYTPALCALSAFCYVLCYRQQHSHDFLPAVFISRPAKIVPEMTYNVLSGTLSLYTTTSQVDLEIFIGTWHDTQNYPHIPRCPVYVCIQNFSPLVIGVVGVTASPLFSSIIHYVRILWFSSSSKCPLISFFCNCILTSCESWGPFWLCCWLLWVWTVLKLVVLFLCVYFSCVLRVWLSALLQSAPEWPITCQMLWFCSSLTFNFGLML